MSRDNLRWFPRAPRAPRAPLCESLECRQLLATLPANFTETFIARVPTSTASTMAFAPDGRLFVADTSAGKIRIVKNNSLLGTEFLSLNTDHFGERGINGIAFDPNYASGSPYLYVYYTTNSSNPVNRLSRFRASSNSDIANPAEEILLDNIPSPTGFHNGGALHFGADQMLYLGVGDGAGTNGPLAQSLSSLSGKILRLNATNPANIIPGDNPFVSVTGARPEIWAIGFRNPFSGAIKPGTNQLYINDVGQATWEELNEVQKGKNYGWPNAEGQSSNPAYVNPLYTYGGFQASRAITGGAFYTKTQFPGEYQNDYFFADYTQGWIKTYDPSSKIVSNFAAGSQQYLDLDVDAAGNLWTLELNGTVRRISYVGSTTTNRSPIAKVKLNPPGNAASGAAPLTVNFAGNESYDPDNPTEPLSFNWDFGDGTFASGMYATRTFTTGGTYNARLTVTDSKGASNTSAPFTITVSGGTTTTNRAPIAKLKLNPPGNVSSGPAPLTVNFAGNESYDPDNPAEPLTFNWNFGDGTTGTGMYFTKSYTTAGTYQATLAVTDSKGAFSTTAPLTIDVTGGTTNRAPTATISAPLNGTLYSGGSTINFSGSATDPEQGNLPASALTWSFVFHHDTHTHPFLPDVTGVFSSTFSIPTQNEPDVNQFYRITLTARDNAGLTHSTFVDIKPRTSFITINTNIPVAGATLTLDGQPFTTTRSVDALVNQTRAIGAPPTQVINGVSYTFTGWSDGGAATHDIAVPALSTTYTAMYELTPDLPPGTAETLRAEADTFVRDGQYSASIFGSIPDLQVKNSTFGYTREAYLRFGMTRIADIGTARLRILGRFSGPESTNVPLGLFTTSDISWSETSTNYFNRPATSGSPIAQVNVLDTTLRWYEFDVTNFLKQQKSAGATGVGFALKALTSSIPYMIFSADESGNFPELIVTPANPSASTTLIPTDDTYTRDGSFATTNFGSSPDLIAKLSTPGFTREFFLRFAITPYGSTTSAKLRLFGSLDNAGSINLAAVGTYPFWTENTVTFSSRPPPLSGILTTTTVASTTGQWYEWDVTDYVRQRQQLGNDALALTIRATNSTIQFARFNSSEAASNQPQLVLT